jgi:hypothetical protein
VALVWGEPDLDRLLARGRPFDLPVKVRRGERNQCHRNAASLWVRDPERYRLVTGYALTGGVWRQHCWVTDAKCLYDATGRADRYFGFELEPIEAADFWYGNVIETQYPRVLKTWGEVLDRYAGPLAVVQRIREAHMEFAGYP